MLVRQFGDREPSAVFQTNHRAASLMPTHRHEPPYLSIVLDGAYTELSGDEATNCQPGTVIFHRPGEEHADYFASDVVCLNVTIPLHVACSAPRRLEPDDQVRRAIADVLRAFYQRRTVEACKRSVGLLLSSLGARRADQQNALPGWLVAALERFDWIDAQPLRNVARLSGVHQTHFSRAFRRHFGTTPNAYRRRARVRAASRMLLGTTHRVAIIASDCGFSDQSHLTHVFREETGVTPDAFRRIFAR